MCRGMIKGLVLKEVGGVVCIVGEAQVVRVRVWAMTDEVIQKVFMTQDF